jgi:hypothetical protein
MKNSPTHSPLYALLTLCVCASIWLSLNTIQQSIVTLPAADVWQHITLIEQAASGQLNIPALLQKHNQVHFIPLPKLVYTLDIILLSGSGVLTACISVFFTLLCGVLIVYLIFSLDTIGANEKKLLSLTSLLWLTSVVQWESFVNPANLQWSGLNAAVAMIAAGFQRHRMFLIMGTLLAIGFGAQWWLLLAAFLCTCPQRKYLLIFLTFICVSLLFWEILNGYWLQEHPPLLLQILDKATKWTPTQWQENSTAFFGNPTGFYFPLIENSTVFLASFLTAPLERLLPNALLIPMAGILLFALINSTVNDKKNSISNGKNRSYIFILAFTALTGLAAALLRSPFEHAYTLRFANTGLLFITASMIVLYTQFSTQKFLCIAVITLYSAALLYINIHEAHSVTQNSNQRRLSQVAYALDVQDMRATSEIPFAPLQALSFNEINARKPVLQRNGIGIYHSLEHRIYTGDLALPQASVQCDYSQLQAKTLHDDALAYKITGHTRDSKDQAMTHVLFISPSAATDSNDQPRGYGIPRNIGATLWQQLTTPPGWAGFTRGASAGSNIRIIAYSDKAHCQPMDLPLP